MKKLYTPALVGIFLLAAGSLYAQELPLEQFRIKTVLSNPERLQKAIVNLHNLNLPANQRLAIAAQWFLGLPYMLDPMGEGKGFDPHPVYVLSRADCLSLIEVALGFVYAKNLQEAKEFTLNIRYKDGKIEYSHRRHLVLAQWIPYLTKIGKLKDVSAEVAPDKVVHATKRIDKKRSCAGRWKAFCKRMGEQLPQGEFAYSYIPIDAAIANAHKIPSGTIVFFLHTPRPYLPYQVFHVAVAIRKKDGKQFLLHASKHDKQTTMVPFARYLKSLKRRYKKWPVAGVLLYLPVD